MMPTTLRLQILLVVFSASVAGCGQVSVFGHTIGEKPAAESNSAPGSVAPGKAEPIKPEPIRAEPPNAATTVVETPVPTKVASSTVPLPHIQKVKSVKIVLVPQIAGQVAEDSRFSSDALLAAIKSELTSRKLLDENDMQVNATAEVSIDEYSMLPTSNAIIFGNIISSAKLSGNIQLRDIQGNDLPGYRVEAASRISIPANGESKNPLGPLYRRFALIAGDFLAGTPGKSTESVEQRPH